MSGSTHVGTLKRLAAEHGRAALRAGLGLAALLAAGLAPASAQMIDCDRLRAQIDSLGRGGGNGSGQYAAAAQKQRQELNRTIAYAQSIGCDRQRFLIFGEGPPPQCGTINAQISRMRANLGSLEASAGGGDDSRRRSLTLQYNAYCRGGQQQVAAPAPQRQRGFLESLFGQPDAPVEQVPLEDPNQQTLDDKPRGGGQAVCVRKCDGGFFPLPISARRGNDDALEDLCAALCPNAETEVFTRSSTADIETARGLDGSAYSALPNAKKFEKSFDPSCTCKPANQSWTEALASAEKILGERRKSDIIVTPEKAQELSQPKELRQETRRKNRKETAGKPAEPDLSALEGMSGSLAPTAGKETTAIGGAAAPSTVLGPDQGAAREMIGPDGATRRVRTVGPML